MKIIDEKYYYHEDFIMIDIYIEHNGYIYIRQSIEDKIKWEIPVELQHNRTEFNELEEEYQRYLLVNQREEKLKRVMKK